MPITVIKGSFQYAVKNKLFFLFVSALIFVLYYFSEIYDPTMFVLTFLSIFCLVGYGLQITEDVINGGTRLPKIMPKKLINLGVKGFIIHFFYLLIQVAILGSIAGILNSPVFEMEELLIDLPKLLMLFFNHDWISCIIFFISGFVVYYVTVFFKELSLAIFANSKDFKRAFNLRQIKRAIDIIGWRRYTIGYSKIIFSVMFLVFFAHMFHSHRVIEGMIVFLCYFTSFIIEYRGIGNVYKVYVENKKNSP